MGTICNPRYICFFSWQLNERLNRHNGFNVIFAAVYYDGHLVFHDVIILLVYMIIFLHRGPQGRIGITA